MIPWHVTTENTMERLLKLNPLWANAKCQMQVGLNAAIVWENLENFSHFCLFDDVLFAIIFISVLILEQIWETGL